jgi:hypothetical protein
MVLLSFSIYVYVLIYEIQEDKDSTLLFNEIKPMYYAKPAGHNFINFCGLVIRFRDNYVQILK